jgi:hypothetical protein
MCGVDAAKRTDVRSGMFGIADSLDAGSMVRIVMHRIIKDDAAALYVVLCRP